MDVSFYKQQLSDIELNATKDKNNLISEFAISNNKVSIGDIVQDYIGKGLVEGIGITMQSGNGLPSCVYRCLELTLKGVPKKRSVRRDVFQCNLTNQE